jgi:hypothetical protein
LDGTLALIDRKYIPAPRSGDLNPVNPLIILLDGWNQGRTPSQQFFANDILPVQSIIDRVPEEVLLEILTFPELRDQQPNQQPNDFVTTPCEIKMEKNDGGYSVSANYSVCIPHFPISVRTWHYAYG